MKLNNIMKNNEKNNIKKSKDSLYKNNNANNSNYHKKIKTETNIYEIIPKDKNKITIKSINSNNSKISFLPENSPKKRITNFNSVYPFCSPTKEKLISKVKNSNNKKTNTKNNIQQNNESLFLRIKNINYSNYFSKKKERNTFACKDKDFPIKKNTSNTSLSFIQKLKGNNSIEYYKKNNNIKNKSIRNISMKSNKKKEYLDLNKKVKKEKKMNLSELNSSKSTYNFLKEDPILFPKYNKKNIYFFENSDPKNSSINFSYLTVNNNGLLLIENRNQNIQKFKSFNSSISSSMIGRNNNKKSTIGQYYVDIDLSLNSNISKDNKCKNNDLINNNNKQVLKKQ